MTNTIEPISLSARVALLGITLHTTHVLARPGIDDDDWSRSASHWRCRLLRDGGKAMTIFYSMGSAYTAPPDVVSVLDSLLSEAGADQQTFEEWAGELGYDLDSRKAERTWRACRVTARKLRQFLGDDYDLVVNQTERE